MKKPQQICTLLIWSTNCSTTECDFSHVHHCHWIAICHWTKPSKHDQFNSWSSKGDKSNLIKTRKDFHDIQTICPLISYWRSVWTLKQIKSVPLLESLSRLGMELEMTSRRFAIEWAQIRSIGTGGGVCRYVVAIIMFICSSDSMAGNKWRITEAKKDLALMMTEWIGSEIGLLLFFYCINCCIDKRAAYQSLETVTYLYCPSLRNSLRSPAPSWSGKDLEHSHRTWYGP